MGDKVVHICTGLENLYEGIPIATVKETPLLQPVVYGSAGKFVVSAYDRDGKRAKGERTDRC
jgi:hypothetical protein